MTAKETETEDAARDRHQLRTLAVAITTLAGALSAVAVVLHAKVCEAPAPRSTGPAGTGPSRDAISPDPGPASIEGVTPLTAAPPVLVTVTVTSNNCPVDT